MVASLTRFARRRLGNSLILAVLLGTAWALQRGFDRTLHYTAVATGLALFFTCVFLAFFNARKKLPFIPMLRAATWTQLHVYAGWFSVGLFLLHTSGGPTGARGPFLTVLGVLFWLVAGSGVAGLIISRIYPARLRLHGENIIFERIPSLRFKLQQEVEALVWKSVNETKSFTLAEFYATRLKSYFARPHHTFHHLIKSDAPLQTLLGEVALLQRYMVDTERVILAEITDCIRAKDNLDFQLACQGLLKYWLFIHIPLTFSLLILGFVHGVQAWIYTGPLH
jgi:hypothetical protein